jgi:tetrapyrrole methylase family protein/MazG family protein
VMFHAQIAKNNKAFDIEDVIVGLINKLKRRHPHVYGKLKLKTTSQIIKNWQKIKKEEKTPKKNKKPR